MTDLTEVAADIYRWAVGKGFYDPVDPEYYTLATELLEANYRLARRLEEARKPGSTHALYVPRFNNGKVILNEEDKRASLALMLIITEVCEAFESIVEGDSLHEAEEVADIMIRLLDYAGYRGMDIQQEVDRKMTINRGRPYKHGKNF